MNGTCVGREQAVQQQVRRVSTLNRAFLLGTPSPPLLLKYWPKFRRGFLYIVRKVLFVQRHVRSRAISSYPTPASSLVRAVIEGGGAA